MAVELENIRRVRLFSQLTEEEQRQLAKLATLRHYPNGATIFKEGESGHELCVVSKGVVNILKKIESLMREEETQTLTSLRSGEWFGIFTFFRGGLHSASAVAEGNVTLVVLEQEAFNQLVKENPALGYKVMRETTIFLGELLREMTKRFTGLVSYLWGDKR